MQAFGSRCVVMMFELVECGIERPERMTQEAVVAVERGAIRCGHNRMRTLIVRDGDGVAVRVAGIVVRKRNRAPTEAGKEEKRDTGTAAPRLTAEHRTQLSDWGVLRQALGDWEITEVRGHLYATHVCARRADVRAP